MTPSTPLEQPEFNARTRADARGLPADQQQALLLNTFQWLRPGQAMEIRLDAQDDVHRWFEQRQPGRYTWAAGGEQVTVRRLGDGAQRHS